MEIPRKAENLTEAYDLLRPDHRPAPAGGTGE